MVATFPLYTAILLSAVVCTVCQAEKNPGISVTFGQKLISWLEEQLANAIPETIVNLVWPNIDAYYFTITDLNITEIDQPTVRITVQNETGIQVTTDIGEIKGRLWIGYLSDYKYIPDMGVSVNAKITDMTIVLTVALWEKKGQPQAEICGCNLEFGKLSNEGSLSDAALKWFDKEVIHAGIRDGICKAINSTVKAAGHQPSRTENGKTMGSKPQVDTANLLCGEHNDADQKQHTSSSPMSTPSMDSTMTAGATFRRESNPSHSSVSIGLNGNVLYKGKGGHTKEAPSKMPHTPGGRHVRFRVASAVVKNFLGLIKENELFASRKISQRDAVGELHDILLRGIVSRFVETNFIVRALSEFPPLPDEDEPDTRRYYGVSLQRNRPLTLKILARIEGWERRQPTYVIPSDYMPEVLPAGPFGDPKWIFSVENKLLVRVKPNTTAGGKIYFEKVYIDGTEDRFVDRMDLHKHPILDGLTDHFEAVAKGEKIIYMTGLVNAYLKKTLGTTELAIPEVCGLKFVAREIFTEDGAMVLDADIGYNSKALVRRIREAIRRK